MSYLWPLIHTGPLGFLPPRDSDSELGPILRESPPLWFPVRQGPNRPLAVPSVGVSQ